jgi:hypothetical protein
VWGFRLRFGCAEKCGDVHVLAILCFVLSLLRLLLLLLPQGDGGGGGCGGGVVRGARSCWLCARNSNKWPAFRFDL